MTLRLFDGEELINIKNKEIASIINLNDNQINEKYIQGQVRIVTEQARYPLNTICKMIDSQNYVLRPNFQRRHRWSREKQSRLIESFIMNVPISPIFLYEQEFASYEVMDGLQRLTAIVEFYKDNYALEGLEYWSELNGRRYSQLPKAIQQGIDRRYLSSIILLKETASSDEEAERLKQLVFDRINSGGARLEYQESRNALYGGNFNQLAIELSRTDSFCSMFDIPLRTENEDIERDNISTDLAENNMFKVMADVEMVVRFFAMRFIDAYEGITLKKFLDRFTDQANMLPGQTLNQYKDLFIRTSDLVYSIYRSDAFKLWRYNPRTGDWRLSQTPAKILYDPIMYVASQYIDNLDNLTVKTENIRYETERILKEKYEDFNGRKGSKADIQKRIDYFIELFDRYAN